MTPLIVLVGFLGAGKTTLLRSLVRGLIDEGCIPTVILNDFANAGVDAELFRELEAKVKPISGACVCCDAGIELLEELDHYEHKEKGVLLLETNGTTDAGEIITLLATDPKLRKFTLPVQVSVIDVKRWQKRFWNNGLEREQAKTAACLYWGHLDEVDTARKTEVVLDLVKRHPALPAKDLEELTKEIAEMVREGTASEREAATGRGRKNHEENRLRHLQTHRFSAVELALPDCVEKEIFVARLKELPLEILRAKGVVRFSDSPEKIWIFQKTHRSDFIQLIPIEGETIVKSPLAVFVAGTFPEGFAERFLEGIS